MSGYLRSARAPARARGLRGPDLPRPRADRCGTAHAQAARVRAHRLERERALIAALERGAAHASRSCSTRPGRTFRRRCGRRPPRRSPRTSTSSRRSSACRRGRRAAATRRARASGEHARSTDGRRRRRQAGATEPPGAAWRGRSRPPRLRGLAVPADRRLRLPLGLPHRRAASPPTARSSGCACRTSTRRRCSARCSTAARAAGGWARTASTCPPAAATSPAPT